MHTYGHWILLVVPLGMLHSAIVGWLANDTLDIFRFTLDIVAVEQTSLYCTLERFLHIVKATRGFAQELQRADI